jgi:AraC-like DNA-binding protein
LRNKTRTNLQLTPYDIECLHTARELIRKDVCRHHTIQQIARYANLSPTKLKKGFKEFFCVGLYEYLEIKRLERSKEMIAEGNKSLKQISKAIGYDHPNNYSRAFKRRYGISPSKWRKIMHSILITTGHLFQFLLKLASFTTV